MTTLADLIHQNYSKNPDKTAIILQHAGQDDKPVSYLDLVKGSAQYAQTYAEAGIQPGEVVILILQHGEDLVYSFWGAILHGAIPAIMPFLTEKLSPERYRADLTALLSVTQPAAIVTYPEFEADIRAALTADGSVRRVLLTSQLAPRSEPDFNQLRGLQCKPTDIVLLQHSSGTTGLQKGVALSHQAVLNQLNAYTRAIQLTSDDVLVSWLPLYHDMGLIAGFLMPILMGITLVLQSPFDWVRAPHKLFQSVSKYKGTLSWLPNFSYNFCAQKVRERDLEGVDLSSWRVITNCSEPVKWESHQSFFQRFEKYGLRESALNCSYAMAENVFGVTQTPLGTKPVTDEIDRASYINERIANPPQDGKPALKMMSSGRALPNTRLLILSEDGKPLPDKVIGEIALQSDCMLTGYYHRPDATEKALRDGWYLTGDYGYTVNGEIFVAGRKKDMIIVGGKNVYPQDLESLAYEVPGIHAGRAVAFGIEDTKAGTEEVVIVAEVDTDDPEERQRIADALRKHITQNSAIALRHAHLVDPKWIVKTSSGKTARSANREKFLKEMDMQS
ncbi:MAG TPA: AMP-binding protein [Anaerolineales bacterium]|nr:AMP-binding protein [Anaerolineales bacterium]HNO83139.1 AMP-binding protein [Anaerolineales bacterium]